MKKKLKKMLAPMTPSNEEVIKKSPKMALCQKRAWKWHRAKNFDRLSDSAHWDLSNEWSITP